MMRKIILDPDGDVCLRLQEPTQDEPQHGGTAQHTPCPGESKATVDLIVSSKILATASPVFKSMFHGKFKEGTELAASQASSALYVQELPEDNTEATITLCALLHFKIEHVPENPVPMALVRLAGLANKYLCEGAVHFPCKLWLKHQLEVLVLPDENEARQEPSPQQMGSFMKGLCQCLYVAYIVDIPREYATVFNMLVLAHMGTSTHDGNLVTYLEDLKFRHDIVGRLTSQRAKCLAVIYDKMMNTKQQPMRLHRGGCTADGRGHFINALEVEGIWPTKMGFDGISIGKIIRRAPSLSARLGTSDGQTAKFPCGCASDHRNAQVWAEELIQECSSLKDRLTGRSAMFYSQHECLDCLKSSDIPEHLPDGNKKQECRIEHKHT